MARLAAQNGRRWQACAQLLRRQGPAQTVLPVGDPGFGTDGPARRLGLQHIGPESVVLRQGREKLGDVADPGQGRRPNYRKALVWLARQITACLVFRRPSPKATIRISPLYPSGIGYWDAAAGRHRCDHGMPRMTRRLFWLLAISKKARSMSTRRQVIALGAASAVSACAPEPASTTYDSLANAVRKPLAAHPDMVDLVRYASLAANGHNTQAWRFAVTPKGVRILPDFSRRTPAVDPDDHHLFVSLGCACENLSLAAATRGRPAMVAFRPEDGGQIDIELRASQPRSSVLFDAIPRRQSTRSEYSGAAVSAADLKQLEQAVVVEGVSVLILTDRAKLDSVRDFVVHGNSLQMEDPAFTAELKHWIRFNPKEAGAKRDGLFSGCTGNPAIPTWMGKAFFPLVFVEKTENDTYAKHMASSPGVAVFVGDKADPDHWIRVGRSVQRFALQATALGLKYAVVNQPVEVASVRTEFAKWLDLGTARPDFVLRFGYGKPLPMSLRRPTADIVVSA